MDELLAMLEKEVGLSPEQAKGAIGGVMGFMKDKLPADVMDQITSLPGVGDFMNSLSGAASGAVAAATGAAGAAAGAATDAAGAATDAAAGAKDSASSTTSSIVDSVKGLFGKS
jgi:ribosomal protein L12E/L44/L45/RPP1/RPP2